MYFGGITFWVLLIVVLMFMSVLVLRGWLSDFSILQ